MPINAKTLEGCKLDARDRESGKAREFCFDDRHWIIRLWVNELVNS
jgi:hypothetical protein